MNTDRFDALLRSLSAMPSRRTALRLLVGSTLGGLLPLGTLSTDAKKGGKGKGKGTGKKGKGKKVAICHNGQTIRVAQPVAKVLLKLGDRKGPCSTPNPPNPPPSGPTCTPACRAGMRCVKDQCVVGQGTCPTGANSCTSTEGVISCGLQEIDDRCDCHTSTEGQTRCADGFAIDERSVCGQCASSAECATLYPAIPGVFCLKVTGAAGDCCSPDTRGFCLAPCPTPATCSVPEDCPDTLPVCHVRTCTNNLCGKAFADEGTPSSPERQTSGDCRVMVCDGNGDDRSEEDNTDLPNPTKCTLASCDNGAPVHEPSGTPCSGGECDGAGHCVTAP